MTFNLQEWKKQGEQALEDLESRKDDLEQELDKVETQIKDLKESLGMSTAPTRRKLRPAVLEYMKNEQVEAVSLGTLIQEVFDGDESVSDSLDTSLKRLSRKSAEFVYEDGVLERVSEGLPTESAEEDEDANEA